MLYIYTHDKQKFTKSSLNNLDFIEEESNGEYKSLTETYIIVIDLKAEVDLLVKTFV